MKDFSNFKHEPKVCPACQNIFECRSGNVEQCQCNSIRLEASLQDKIQDRYSDCLCAACLEKIRREHTTKAFYDRIKKLFGLKRD